MNQKMSSEEKIARRRARTMTDFQRKHGPGAWQQLLDLYESGQSFQEIAGHFGVSHQAIRELLIRTGIHNPAGALRRRRARQAARRMDDQVLQQRLDAILRQAATDEHYWSRRGQLSLEVIRKELGLSTGRWYKFIQKYPLPQGRVEVVLRYGMNQDPLTYLQQQYEAGWPIATVAARLQGVRVSPTTLHRYMRRLGIPMRTISEARLMRRRRDAGTR